MIITKTPFRVSFFGGGTDYPDYYLENGGSVLTTSIDKYCYITCRYLPPFFDHKYRVVYSKIENTSSIEEIEHPAVRGVLQYTKNNQGLEIHHDGDLPARSGLGSSSSFTVGLLNAVNSLDGKSLGKEDLALGALEIEQKILDEPVGSQDQIIAAYGGLNKIDFKTNGSFSVTPVILDLERKKKLENNILLFFTGVTRFSSTVSKKKIKNLSKNKITLRIMGDMVMEGLSILKDSNTDLRNFGRLLNDSWRLKQELANGVTNIQFDKMYQAGMDAGALGGKILGAGGGGFMAFYVEEENHEKVIDKLKNFLHIPIKFESHGSEVCVFKPDFF